MGCRVSKNNKVHPTINVIASLEDYEFPRKTVPELIDILTPLVPLGRGSGSGSGSDGTAVYSISFENELGIAMPSKMLVFRTIKSPSSERSVSLPNPTDDPQQLSRQLEHLSTQPVGPTPLSSEETLTE